MAQKLGKTDDPATLSNGITAVAFNDFYREYSGSLTALETAQGNLRNILKRAKSAGIDTAMMKRARSEQRMDPDALKAQIKALDSYRRFMGLPTGTQAALDLEDQAAIDSATVEDAAARGLAAGKAGHNLDSNPFDPGTLHFQAFDKNWHAGQRLLAEGLGGTGRSTPPPAKPAKNGAGRRKVPHSELLPRGKGAKADTKEGVASGA